MTQNGYHLLPSVVVSYKQVSNIWTYFSLTHVLLPSAEDISCSCQFSPLFRVVFLFIFTSLLRYVFVNFSYVLLKNPSPIWRRPLFLFWSCTTTSSYSCLRQLSNFFRLFQRDFEHVFTIHESVNIELVTFRSRRLITAKENEHSDPKVRLFLTQIKIIIFQKKKKRKKDKLVDRF